MPTALVTGGSRGVGRGVVEGLAESGFTVVFTGRDRRRLDQVRHSAEALGGNVLARLVDHNDDSRVAALFAEIGRAHELDLLVNSVWGGYERMIEGGRFTWSDPFWKQPLWRWDAMMSEGVRAAFVATQLATPLMLGRPRGLIVNLSYWSAQKHLGNTLYGIAKAATDKMTSDTAVELSESSISVISLYPGLVRTERVMENADHFDLSSSESPRFIGRTVAAIWQHPDFAAEHSGRVCVAADCARTLGVTDTDGTSPAPLTLEDA